MEQFLESCFSWPTLPASILLLCVSLYWALMMLGAVDLDVLDLDVDFDTDIDVDADISILQVGFVPIKWLNIGSVPTMLWISIFSLANWMVSRAWSSPAPHDVYQFGPDTLAIFRDFGIAALITKAFTQPLRGRFDPVEPNRAEDLVGRICTVTTSEVTETFGEAELPTDAAPLRLKVRNTNEEINRGDAVLIVDFETEGNLFFVTKYDDVA